jgi:uncharacterized membrane protein SpoIIM required for sporulation
VEWLSSSLSRQQSQHSRQQSSWLGRFVWFVFLFVFLFVCFSSSIYSVYPTIPSSQNITISADMAAGDSNIL